MGVQVAAVGKRSLNADLNLVPFIDLLSVLITFLLATVVWIQVESLPLDQLVGTGGFAGLPPLTIRLAASSAWVGRDPATGALIPAAADFDWRAIERQIARDRADSDEAAVVVSAEDGVEYGAVVHALDLARAHGYDEPEIAAP